jgi:hypothetical protein
MDALSLDWVQSTALVMTFGGQIPLEISRRERGTRIMHMPSCLHFLMLTIYRYLNMDFLFYSSLKQSSFRRLVISYDIACQWGIHFSEQMVNKFPSEWFINSSDTELVLLVPKFHLLAHIESCHADYSFNNTPGVARTDGEAPERGWSRINDLAPSTRKMGPGARRDKLEDHMGDSNWKKTISLGKPDHDMPASCAYFIFFRSFSH